jgi:class 3 adenylate cyclase
VLEEPVRGVPASPSYYAVSGREQASAWQRGDLPATPLTRLVGYRPTQVGSGSATVMMAASPWLQYAEGTVDVKILVEETMRVAVLTGLPPATRIVTTSLSIHHLRPSTVESESFVARARVLNSGSAFTTVEALVEDALGRTIAHVTGTFMLRPLDPPPDPQGDATYEEPTYATPDPHLRPSPPPIPTASMSMIEAAQKAAAGEVEAPINRLLGARVAEFGSNGAGMVAMSASPWLCSLWTEVQPGAIAAVMHMGLGLPPIARTSADEYIGIVSQELAFLATVPADGRELVAPFKLVHDGELLVSSIEVLDADGHRVAMGSQTSVLRERRRRRARSQPAERILATVLFTDIVGSTARAQELGDQRWRELLTEHQELVRRELKTFGGREVKTTGDGFLASFDSPARAVQCARAVRDGVRGLGLEIRAGIHTGECERVGQDLAGIAVHAAARIEAAAGAGEVLVSSTVHDLVAGSGLTFADRGLHELKGIDGQRQLFAVAD